MGSNRYRQGFEHRDDLFLIFAPLELEMLNRASVPFLFSAAILIRECNQIQR